MQAHLSIWHLIWSADPLVKWVMFFLLAVSLVSWSLMIRGIKQLKVARLDSEAFEQRFWSGQDMHALYQQLENRRHVDGLPKVFQAGLGEYMRLQALELHGEGALLVGVEKVMSVAVMRESDRLNRGWSWLATIGSVSPYVGLFGTVWGIMGSFQAIANVQQVTLSMVAPGISEALIATAMGLFVAIPAVVAYNRLSANSDAVVSGYENFQDEFYAVLYRQSLKRSRFTQSRG